MSQNPTYPDAHPTAPGGMSEKQLAAELLRAHGDSPEGREMINALTWPQKIEAVIESRRQREQESQADESDLDPEQMFAEIQQAQAEAKSAAPAPLFIGLPGVKDFIFDGHMGAGPSGAERWMTCTASLGAARKFLETLTPNQQREFAKSGDAARQGTTAHAAAETEALLMLGKIDQAEADMTLMELAVMPDTEGEAFSDEMAEYIREYLDLIKTYVDERGDEAVMIEAVVEAGVPLTDLHGGEVYDIRGSGDFVALPTKGEPTVVVGDLKYGDGIYVTVDANPQIRIYALGVLALLADPETGEIPEWVKDVVYHIIQPRLGGIKTWTESVDDLLTWRDEVLAPALTRALYGVNEGATYVPSEKACQWCPARGGCAALAEQRVEQASDLFDVIVTAEFADGPGAFPDVPALSDERLGELLTQITALTDIKDDLKAEAQRRLYRGGQIPGYQLVSYTPPRKWKEGAAEALTNVNDQLTLESLAGLWTEPGLVSPTAAMKLLKDDEEAKTLIEPLVDAPPKRPVVAREGDRRKTWEGRPPEQMFPETVGDE